jgi:HEAT repeat protein
LHAAALRALGSTGDPATLDALLEAARPGHSRNSRTAALEGLGSLMQKAKPNEQQRQRILKVFSDALASDSPFFRFSVLNSLRGIGEAAKPLLPAVEKLSREDSLEFLRENAKQTAELIRGKSTTTEAPDLKQLREEINRLKREQETLRERLNKYEKNGKK